VREKNTQSILVVNFTHFHSRSILEVLLWRFSLWSSHYIIYFLLLYLNCKCLQVVTTMHHDEGWWWWYHTHKVILPPLNVFFMWRFFSLQSDFLHCFYTWNMIRFLLCMGMVIMHEETLECIHFISCLCESLGNHGGLVLYRMICCISLCEFLSLSWM
jgi:hypothetical protein